ncbi:MAG: hypothetical protein AAF581_21220 [Planctomycetota bacterium]
MTITLTVRDETTAGETNAEFTLDFLTEETTVRELIRSRVYQEVKDFNTRRPELFRGLVQPTDSEKTLNGYRFRKARKQQVDWNEQYQRALEAFQKSGFLILIDDQQMTDLDETIVVGPKTVATFLKLIPLVGG